MSLHTNPKIRHYSCGLLDLLLGTGYYSNTI